MIYFMQPVSGGPIKIGFTANVERRRVQLEAHYGVRLVVLAVIKGDKVKERELHRKFSRHRLRRTEQFQPDSEILSFIGQPLLDVRDTDVADPVEPRFGMVRVSTTAIKWAKKATPWSDKNFGEFVSELVIAGAKERIREGLLELLADDEKPKRSK